MSIQAPSKTKREPIRRKPISRSRRVTIWITALCAYLAFRLIHFTLRYRIIGGEHRRNAEKASQKRFALATWHQNTLLGMMSHAGQNVCVMVSSSLDGEIISWIANKFDMETARGSSTRGGRAALSEMIQHTESGGRTAFTVDGPTGPAKEVKSGIVSLASRTGVPILPVAAIAKNYWSLSKTWDQFRIPKPFSKVHVFYGPAIEVDRYEDPTVYTEKLKETLLTLDAMAQGMA